MASILTIFTAKLYFSTRYSPVAALMAVFMLAILGYAVWMPATWLSSSEVALASFFLDFAFLALLPGFFFFVLFFEGIKGNYLSKLFVPFIIVFSITFGYAVATTSWNNWYSFVDNMWHQTFEFEFNILFVLLGLSVLIIVLYRLSQFIREKESGRSKKYPVIALIGWIIAIVSMFLDIPNVDTVMSFVSMSVVGIAFLKDPNSFFASNTKIKAVLIIDSESFLPYIHLSFDKRTAKLNLASAGLGAVMKMLQEISQANFLPTKLVHKETGFLIEHNTEYQVCAIIIIEQINETLRAPLQYALSSFISKFRDKLDLVNTADVFESFETDLRRIFQFALPQ